MVEAGAIDGVSGVFGIHAWPSLPSGVIASKVCLSLLKDRPPERPFYCERPEVLIMEVK